MYGGFGVSYFNPKFNGVITSRFEIDLKADPFGNKNSFNAIKAMGYDSDDCEYQIFKKNPHGRYEYEQYLTDKFTLIFREQQNNVYEILFYASVIIGFLCFVLFSSTFLTKNFFVQNDPFAFAYLLLFVLFGIISSFIYMNEFISLPIIIFSILYTLRMKEVWIRGLKKVFVRKIPQVKSEVYEIEI